MGEGVDPSRHHEEIFLILYLFFVAYFHSFSLFQRKQSKL